MAHRLRREVGLGVREGSAEEMSVQLGTKRQVAFRRAKSMGKSIPIEKITELGEKKNAKL